MSSDTAIRIINLTPHEVTIIGIDGSPITTIPASGTTARAQERRERIARIQTRHTLIPINRVSYGDVSGLPGRDERTIYIVSHIVASACPDRADLYIPDETVRDEDGRIIGCRALARI